MGRVLGRCVLLIAAAATVAMPRGGGAAEVPPTVRGFETEERMACEEANAGSFPNEDLLVCSGRCRQLAGAGAAGSGCAAFVFAPSRNADCSSDGLRANMCKGRCKVYRACTTKGGSSADWLYTSTADRVSPSAVPTPPSSPPSSPPMSSSSESASPKEPKSCTDEGGVTYSHGAIRTAKVLSSQVKTQWCLCNDGSWRCTSAFGSRPAPPILTGYNIYSSLQCEQASARMTEGQDISACSDLCRGSGSIACAVFVFEPEVTASCERIGVGSCTGTCRIYEDCAYRQGNEGQLSQWMYEPMVRGQPNPAPPPSGNKKCVWEEPFPVAHEHGAILIVEQSESSGFRSQWCRCKDGAWDCKSTYGGSSASLPPPILSGYNIYKALQCQGAPDSVATNQRLYTCSNSCQLLGGGEQYQPCAAFVFQPDDSAGCETGTCTGTCRVYKHCAYTEGQLGGEWMYEWPRSYLSIEGLEIDVDSVIYDVASQTESAELASTGSNSDDAGSSAAMLSISRVAAGISCIVAAVLLA